MHIDRRAFLATLGSAAVVEAMSSEARADALEHYMLAQLDKAPAAKSPDIRSGAGALFGGPSPSGVRVPIAALAPMPDRPTLVVSSGCAARRDRQPHPAERRRRAQERRARGDRARVPACTTTCSTS
jgi:hypothetical protein